MDVGGGAHNFPGHRTMDLKYCTKSYDKLRENNNLFYEVLFRLLKPMAVLVYMRK
jgi:hypothetical protein